MNVISRILLPLNSCFARANPAIDANTTVPMTAGIVTRKLLRTNCGRRESRSAVA